MELNLAYLSAVEENSSPHEIIPILNRILVLDTGQYNQWFNRGMEYIRIHDYDRAIDDLNRGLRDYPSREHPALAQIYVNLSFCYNKQEKFHREKELLLHASSIFPEHTRLLGRQVICAHSRVRYHEADNFRERLLLRLRQDGLNEAEIAYHMGKLYLTTDYLVAEDYFRSAYQYMPDDPQVQASLAWVLIQNSLRIDEGMQLMYKALEKDPDNSTCLHQLGYGYYVKGELETSLAKLYRARVLHSEYNFELDEHIQMVEEAIEAEE